MGTRTGRPKVKHPKCVDLKVRVDEETNERLLRYCKAHNLTRAQVLRKGLDAVMAEDR